MPGKIRHKASMSSGRTGYPTILYSLNYSNKHAQRTHGIP